MLRTLARRQEDLVSAARGLGFDEQLEKKNGERRTRLHVKEASDGDALTVLRVSAAVSLNEAPELRIRRLTVGRAVAILLGFTRTTAADDPRIQQLAVIETHATLRIRAALGAGLTAVVIELLESFPEAELTAGNGELVIGIEARSGVLERLLALAERAAAALEATKIKPVAREAVARCGFCHGDLLPEEPVVRCDRCAATVHSPCWESHDGCPAMGCAGSAR